MTATTIGATTRSSISPDSTTGRCSWGDLHRVPSGPRAQAAGRIADGLFRHAVSRLPVRVEFPTAASWAIPPRRMRRSCSCTGRVTSRRGWAGVD